MSDKAPMPDEPVFTLMARDPHAPLLVVEWAGMREAAIERGERPESDREAVNEAREAALRMIAWRQANDGAWRQQNPELPGIPEGAKYRVAPMPQQEPVHPFVFTRQRWPGDPVLDGLGGGDVVRSTMGASSLLPAPEDPERNIIQPYDAAREPPVERHDPCALDGPPRTFAPDFELFPKAPHLNKDK
jgi:hypothetical protein